MRLRPALVLPLLAALLPVPATVADAPSLREWEGGRVHALGAHAEADSPPAWPSADLRLDLSDALNSAAAQPQSPTPTADAQALTRQVFGHAGTMWLSVGAGFATDLGHNSDASANVAWSLFLADELEFRLELAGWYFNQTGPDTGAISAEMMLHWHIFHDDDYIWTLFGEVGIGILVGFDSVPSGGTEFNFAPRVGFGWTRRITDDGARLELGVRWRHLSNGRIEGDARNPARDSVMLFAGVLFPF